MQLRDQPAFLTNGSATVYLLWELSLSSVVGTFAPGDGLAFGNGAAAVVVAVNANVVTVYVTTVQQPAALDTLVSDASPAASATVGNLDRAPDLAGAGIDGEEWLIRQGDGVAYRIASTPSNSSAQLSAPYAGVSSVADEALVTLHSERTDSFGLPRFDRRDRELQVLLTEMAQIIDAALQDHETRLIALEP